LASLGTAPAHILSPCVDLADPDEENHPPPIDVDEAEVVVESL
jgi:hypothetical protein